MEMWNYDSACGYFKTGDTITKFYQIVHAIENIIIWVHGMLHPYDLRNNNNSDSTDSHNRKINKR